MTVSTLEYVTVSMTMVEMVIVLYYYKYFILIISFHNITLLNKKEHTYRCNGDQTAGVVGWGEIDLPDERYLNVYKNKNNRLYDQIVQAKNNIRFK